MDKKNNQHIFFIDDEEAIRSVAERCLTKAGYKVTCFEDPEKCLDNIANNGCHLLITDVKMPKMDGFTLLRRAKQQAPWIPVLVVTGYGNIPMATRAMKLGADDFIEKPLQKNIFLQKINEMLTQSAINPDVLPGGLTKSQQRVLKLMLQGKSNSEMAFALKRSLRTIEMHRSHIMHKFDVDNMVDLLKKVSGH